MSHLSFDPSSIIGKSVEEAQKIAGWSGYILTIKSEDGTTRPVQLNTSFTRILVDVEKGMVKNANVG